MTIRVDEDDIQAFLAESRENLSQIEHDILLLEKTPTAQESLVRIYRSLHSIKGNCGFLPFPKLEAIAHAGETLLGEVREQRLAFSGTIATLLLQTVDALREFLRVIETTGEESKTDYSTLIKTLETIQNTSFIETAPVANEESTATTIRVKVELLDQVMTLVEELVLARNQVVQFSERQPDSAFSATCKQLSLITSDLQEGVMKTRMQPLSTVFQKMPRVVRDVAIACGKDVQLKIEGAETELDRSMIEAIKDPLTHLIRNCIDHGIESPDVRSRQSKPSSGKITVRAFHEHGTVNIEISDDGRGIDPEHLRQKAHQLGFLNPGEGLNERESFDLMFLPGFSTAEEVTNLSGRGVGMDVVRSNLEQVNGSIDVRSEVGIGTTFRMRIPLTLAIVPALLMTSSGVTFAIAQANIQELVRLEEHQIQLIETLYNVPVYRLRGTLLPLIYLHRVLELEARSDDVINIVVVQADEYRFGIVVDEIIDVQEVVVKPLGKQLKDLEVYAGATILGDGRVALILDAIGLAEKAGVTTQLEKRLSTIPSTPEAISEAIVEQQMILLINGPENARMGIPMAHATRLETFSQTEVERIGHQTVVQYRDRILPLIDLHPIFGGEELSAEDFSAVVVTLKAGDSVGIKVDQILDIVEDPLSVKGSATRPGIRFCASIQGQVTEFLDLDAIVQMTNPYLLQQAG
jgi:two-component system, chemotaxis family, sensor kinase CheA